MNERCSNTLVDLERDIRKGIRRVGHFELISASQLRLGEDVVVF